MKLGTNPLPELDEIRGQGVAGSKDPVIIWDRAVDLSVSPAPPTHAERGRYWVDENGEISRSLANREYVPSVETAGFRFDSEFEVVLWRVLNGFNNLGHLADAFAATKFLVPAPEASDPLQLRIMPDPQDPELSLLQVGTSRAFVSWQQPYVLDGSAVLETLRARNPTLEINPGTSFSKRFPGREFAQLVR